MYINEMSSFFSITLKEIGSIIRKEEHWDLFVVSNQIRNVQKGRGHPSSTLVVKLFEALELK